MGNIAPHAPPRRSARLNVLAGTGRGPEHGRHLVPGLVGKYRVFPRLNELDDWPYPTVHLAVLPYNVRNVDVGHESDHFVGLVRAKLVVPLEHRDGSRIELLLATEDKPECCPPVDVQRVD